MERLPDPTRRWLRTLLPGEVALAIGGLLPGIALIGVDGTGLVSVWSPEAERLFGWRREEVVGLACPTGLVCDLGKRRAFGARVQVQRSDGSTIFVRQYENRFTSDGGTMLGSVNVFVPEDAPSSDSTTVPFAGEAVEFHGLATRDPAMMRVFDTVRRVADNDVTVLLRGESGTGKELMARAIHDESRRRHGPYVAVNCAALSPTLLESELFGHKKGAFTGADRDRDGIFAQASGGTLLLDEVAEIPLELQAKLLRVLQDHTFAPLGGDRPITADVRVLAATHRSLREEVAAGRFREDLMYRLRVVPLFLPPLRERPLDIELLLRRFVARANARGGRQIRGFDPDAMRALLDHRWPGNVRELENVVEYAAAVGRSPEVGLADLPPELRDAVKVAPDVTDGEAAQIRRALFDAKGDVGLAGASLGMSRTTFWRKRQKYGVVG